MARIAKSKYPVGACWRAIGRDGRIIHIWLAQRQTDGTEIWRWSAAFSDGSGVQFD